MALEDIARAHYTQQSTLTTRAAQAVAELWALLDPGALAKSWTDAELARRLFTVLATFQVAAANAAPAYVAAALDEQGAEPDPQGVLDPRTLAGVASDGRPLESLVAQPLIQVLTAIQDGAQVVDALRFGGSTLSMIAETQVADAGRTAEKVSMVSQRQVTGWVRMLVPPSCGRCAVLAGRFYRWSAGFRRHPRCDCRHIPAVEDQADDLRTDPQAYFRSLPQADQDRYFGAGGAEAIRRGADIAQVVNAARGASGMYTTEGATKRGLAGSRLNGQPRLTPEAIIAAHADDRDAAIEALFEAGYIVNPPKTTR